MTRNRPTSAVDLLQHAEFVRAVASAAVRGDHDVDDVVQETWLSTLRAEPEELRRPRGWLGAVVHRRAADTARSAGRRRAREQRAARDEALEPTVDVVARAETAQCLAKVVLELDDPYREAILLRYFDDLAPREIAERLGVPVETVRTRVKRGLKLLRRKLTDEHGDSTRWANALVALLPAGSVPAGSAAPGGLVLAKKKLLGILAAVIGVLVAFMDVISSPGEAGWYGLGCLVFLFFSLGMVAVNIGLVERKRYGVGLLLAAFAWAAWNLAVFVGTLFLDRFLIFSGPYLIMVALAAPALMLIGLIVVAKKTGKLGSLGVVGFAVWILTVAFTHFWVVAQASGSV
jgi:RNA polymerase sigma-70 factor (ECF subfamily)